jgi:hypothetical protein
VAILDSDGEFIEFYYDSHRIQFVEDADCAPRLVAKLRELLKRLLTPNTFAVGDAVRWKEGLKNKKRPAGDEPAVVAELLPEVVFDMGKDSGGQYFREPLEIKVALLDDDGEVVIYHFDARRLEKVPPEEEAKIAAKATRRPSVTRSRSRSRSGSEGSESEHEHEHEHEPEPEPMADDEDAPKTFPSFFPSSSGGGGGGGGSDVD